MKTKKYKYSLYNELLDSENVLSLLFHRCTSHFFDKIVDKNKGKTDRKLEIELKIDGYVCDPQLFFDTLYNDYEKCVNTTASNLVKKQTSEKFSEIASKLIEFEEITKDWADDINWDCFGYGDNNPLIKN